MLCEIGCLIVGIVRQFSYLFVSSITFFNDGESYICICDLMNGTQ